MLVKKILNLKLCSYFLFITSLWNCFLSCSSKKIGPPLSIREYCKSSLNTRLTNIGLIFSTYVGASIASASTGLSEKVFLVTGSTSGIGRHTSQLLAKTGATVLLHGRNEKKLDMVENWILNSNPKAVLRKYCYDLSSVAGMKGLAKAISQEHKKLDGLLNNAGEFTNQYRITGDKMETTFAVNVAAPYVLSILLLPILKNTVQSRILTVSSTSQNEGDPHIALRNLQFEKGGFSDHAAYSQSKLCVAAVSHELARRVLPEETLIYSCDPGDVDTEMLRAGWPGYPGMPVEEANDEFKLLTRPYDRSLHGKYFVARKETRCNPEVYNDDLRLGLWSALEKLTGVSLQSVGFT